jgi:hypothetical protein
MLVTIQHYYVRNPVAIDVDALAGVKDMIRHPQPTVLEIPRGAAGKAELPPHRVLNACGAPAQCMLLP